MSNMNPIHWECSIHPPENAKVIDLRTLPEEIKVSIIQAALNVSLRFNNFDFVGVEEDSEEEDALSNLSKCVDAIRPFMHEASLVPSPAFINAADITSDKG